MTRAISNHAPEARLGVQLPRPNLITHSLPQMIANLAVRYLIDTMPRERSFEAIVESCRRYRKFQMIDNASVRHASVLVENIIVAAMENEHPEERVVHIVSGNLDAEVYGVHADLAESALAQGVRFKVILTRGDDKTSLNPFFAKLFAKTGQGVSIEHWDRKGAEPSHFILAGRSAYRLELDHDTKKARANFNDPKVGTYLLACFKKIAQHQFALA